jgi:transcriptional regulator with XRE-family HTH domain
MDSDALDIVPEDIPQASDSVNQLAPTVTRSGAKLLDMSTSEPDETRIAKRLRRLLDYLELRDVEFATRAELTPSYVSRLLSGDRGGSGEVPKLSLHSWRYFGIDGRYWTSPVELDPATCQTAEQVDSMGAEERMGSMTGRQEFGPGAMARAELARLSAERDDPPAVTQQIMRLPAPDGADAAWWLRQYFEILKQHS